MVEVESSEDNEKTMIFQGLSLRLLLNQMSRNKILPPKSFFKNKWRPRPLVSPIKIKGQKTCLLMNKHIMNQKVSQLNKMILRYCFTIHIFISQFFNSKTNHFFISRNSRSWTRTWWTNQEVSPVRFLVKTFLTFIGRALLTLDSPLFIYRIKESVKVYLSLPNQI